MNRNIRKPLLCLLGLALSGSALADGTTPCGISTNVLANGTVELSNTGSVVKCEPPAGAPGASSSAPAKPSSSASDAAPSSVSTAAPDPSPAPAADAQAAQTDQSKDPRESYKEAMLQGAPGTTAANPAVSRRYKMMDKATYQATVLGGVNSGAPADAPANTTPAQ